MVTSAGYPPDSVRNLEVNTLFDGLFHAGTYVFVVVGLVLLWRTAHRSPLRWSGRLLAGTVILGLHHVNETVPRAQWIYWDVGFLMLGAGILIGGWLLYRPGRQISSVDLR